ncbi:ABC transporter substrate-binding protein [Arthrobacter sp. HY1533]|uniref:ABC transporter substrate-binding protein n=1 Tax=Arthrobacter sp. HY1533 TaxID=2970919 RepID=UPI0022BA0695|nr:ABC transporter substrate-binding protein [Arthrobacter sp. HY1533]
MRKVLLHGFLAAALLAGASACGSASTATTATQSDNAPAGLLKAGELAICINPEYSPMEYFENGTGGQPIGFDADSAVALANHWGVKPQFTISSFDGLMPALAAKRCDLVWSALYVNADRQKVADASPYLLTGPALVVPSGTDSIKSIDDLSGKSVAVLSGGANEATLKKLSAKFEAAGNPAVEIQSYPQNVLTVAALLNGKVDALIETDVSAVDVAQKSGGKLKTGPSFFDADTQFAVYTAKGSGLTKDVAAGLKALADNGTLATTAQKYSLDVNRIYKGK